MGKARLSVCSAARCKAQARIARGCVKRARLLVGDGAAHDLLADVEVDLARRAADVAKVGVGHLARAVDDAAHDRDRHACHRGGTSR
eukprot:6201318-Pleurochrysis_carterae.AAC.1